jgi:hypothetical protein
MRRERNDQHLWSGTSGVDELKSRCFAVIGDND